jgi:putative oxidoreductase
MTPFRTLLDTTAPGATILVRILIGAVFLSEGIQKFLFSAELGVGRFEKIGIPSPAIAAPFVGSIEVIFGALLIVGLLTRVASLLLLLNISVAILSTKIPILLGTGFWGFSLPKMTSYGFWSMAHEARADFCMFLGSAFLLIVGGGGWSLDRMLARK